MSMTSLPSRWAAKRCSSIRSRGGGTSSISWLAASMRNFGFAVRAGRTATQPGELLLDELLAALLGGAGLALALRLGQHERRVAALVGVDHAVVDLPRRLADLVEEPAVVGDDDERAGRGDEVAGQPGDGLDVEVVGGLVEHDQLVRAEQQRGQRAAATLATGEPERRPGRARRRPAAPRRRRAWSSRRAHSWSARPPSTASRTRVGVDELVALVEVADLDAAVHRDATGVGLLEPGHHLEQGGLAVAVAADDADPLPDGDAERDRRSSSGRTP